MWQVPSWSLTKSWSIRYAVHGLTVICAANNGSTFLSRTIKSFSVSTLCVVQVPVAAGAGITLSPTWMPFTLGPIRSTSATPSLPPIAGNEAGFSGYTPWIVFMSAGLIGEAMYFTKTWLFFSVRSGCIGTFCSTSPGSPKRSYASAKLDICRLDSLDHLQSCSPRKSLPPCLEIILRESIWKFSRGNNFVYNPEKVTAKSSNRWACDGLNRRCFRCPSMMQ